ncbi:MAG: hypothetical protein F7C35_01845 [Desulfurococcales archaeon]|nr:hypothetical protein [Desulfurococcales archaeon]
MRQSELLGRGESFRILIVGEIGTGKTSLTSRIVRALAKAARPGAITVIDFAPDIAGVGKPVATVPEGVRYLRPSGLRAPRLESGGDCNSMWRLARHNMRLTTATLEEFIDNPTPVLVVNDLSIHLHAGSYELLLEAIRKSSSFIGNSYLGGRLTDNCGLSEREKELVNKLMREADIVWRMG